MLKKLIPAFYLVMLLALFIGCSSDSPTLPSGSYDEINATVSIPLGVIDTFPDGSPASGNGALGLYNLHIDTDGMKADLAPLRKSALTDVLEVVDITSFLRLAPCTDCAKLKSISVDIDGNFVLRIGIKHPFPAGDPFKPISGRNRADLHVFNVEGTVVSNLPGTSFPGIGETTSAYGLLNADGYSDYLNTPLDTIYPTEATAHPYILHFNDYSSGNFDPANPNGFQNVTIPPPSGNLVMPMGCDYDYKDYVFDLDGTFDFLYAIGCTYAVSSASKNQRFIPEYRIPQHNKKAASEVSLVVISNDLKAGDALSTAQIEVHVVDISHGVSVGDGLDQMLADSSVNQIFIEIPGITSTPLVLDGSTPSSGTGHDPSDPLVYPGTIMNNASGSDGIYTGIIKVLDNYAPGQNSSPLLNNMDGIQRVDPIANPLTGLFAINEFATYQIFTISVTTGNDIPAAILTPDPANISQMQSVNFDGTGSYDIDGTIDLYEFDFEWDGVQANFTADDSNTTGLATSAPYTTPGSYTAGLRVTDNLGAVAYDSVTVNVSEIIAIYVDDSNTSGTEDGSMQYPYNTIPEGLNAADAGEQVWVDDSGNNYAGPITLKANVTLKSTNWDSSDGGDNASISTAGSPTVTSADGATIDGFKILGGGNVSSFGAVSVLIQNVSTTITNCFIQDLSAPYSTQGIVVQNSTGTVIDGCTISNIQNTSSYGNLNAIYLQNSPITITDNVIYDIIATDNYHQLSAIYATGCSPQSGHNLDIRHNLIHDIKTQGDTFGGSYAGATGIYLTSSSEADIYNNIVHTISTGNYDYNDYSPPITYYTCGMRFTDSATLQMVNNVIYNIKKNYYFGSCFGLLVENCTGFDGRNNIVYYIKKDQHMSAAYGVSAPAGLVWQYCDVFGADSGNYTGGIAAGIGCIQMDPVFVNPGTDFHLGSGSPCINTGDPAINDPDATRSDMGAYGGPGGNW